MTERETATELVKRLEAGETGREIDAAVVRVLEHKYSAGKWTTTEPILKLLNSIGRVSTSLDAAIALVERVLPEGTWSIDHHRKEPCYAGVRKDDWTPPAQSYAPTPAAALLAALLKAEG